MKGLSMAETKKTNSTFELYRGGQKFATVEGERITNDGMGRHIIDVDGNTVYTGDHSVEIIKVK